MIPQHHLGPRRDAMVDAVQSCVHCGFCLPACPTYKVMGEEMDSPRGRIVLMKQVLEGALPLENALPHVDACLGCLSCETACPSGVRYRELISPFREHFERHRDRPLLDRLRRALLLAVLPHPARFSLAAALGVMARPLRRWMPASLRAMLDLLPARLPEQAALSEKNVARSETAGPPRARVALLAGCAQQVLAPAINQATIEVLLSQGVEVTVPRDQGCCGALAWHVGEGEQARRAAIQNLGAFSGQTDAIITNAAGCGSCLHEYPLILKGSGHEEAARAFASRAADVAVFLDRIGFHAGTNADPTPVKVAVQDACHLLHGQGVQSAPRRLLAALPGVQVCEIADPEICCGSAGTYNLDHPRTASDLGARKAAALIASGAEVVVSGNIGCLTQIRHHLQRAGSPMRVMHLMELIAARLGSARR